MDLPNGFRAAFSSTCEGRRFLVNLYTGIHNGHMNTASSQFTAIMNQWFGSISAKYGTVVNANVLSCLQLFDALALKQLGMFASTDDVYSSRSDLRDLSRVIDVDVLTTGPFSLLDSTYIDSRWLSSGPDDKFSDAFNNAIGSLSGNDDALRRGAVVRSRLPLTWAAPTGELTGKEQLLQSPSRADRFRNALATPHFPGIHYLHVLRYPEGIGGSCGLHRPTFVEAGSHPYFRALTEETDRCGRTVNLENLGRGLPDDVGVAEVLVPTLPFTTEFSWTPLGPIDEAPPNPNTTEYERTLCRTPVDSAVEEALRILEGV